MLHEADAYDSSVVFMPSRQAGAELAAWVAYVPFMSIDLRAPVDKRVFPTDARSRTCAAGFTQLPEDLGRKLLR